MGQSANPRVISSRSSRSSGVISFFMRTTVKRPLHRPGQTERQGAFTLPCAVTMIVFNETLSVGRERMTALGQKRSFAPGRPNVRFAPIADLANAHSWIGEGAQSTMPTLAWGNLGNLRI